MTSDEARILAEIVRVNAEIAKALIGVQGETPSNGAPMAVDGYGDPVPDPAEFFSTTEDWEDIPDEPYGQASERPDNVVALPREVGVKRLHLNEDEEDAVALYQLGRITHKDLEDVLKKANLPETELLAEVVLPTTPQAT